MTPLEMQGAALPCANDETMKCLSFYVDGVNGDDFFNGISRTYSTASLCGATTAAKFIVDPNALEDFGMEVDFWIKDADFDSDCFDDLPFSVNVVFE
jgi:hypothetical protein